MRRMALVLALLALGLPIAAKADGINLTNQFGTVMVTTAGAVSSRTELETFNGITANAGGALGSVTFSTGAFLGANLFSSGTFSSTGSSFVVTSGGGYPGLVKNGTVIFTGSFVGPITWTLVSQSGKYNYQFQLSGHIQGTWLNTGRVVSGMTTQNILIIQNQWNVDKTGFAQLGNTNLVVPEPGTLATLGSGLVAIAGAFRRKLFGS
jgi:hypothetical protein